MHDPEDPRRVEWRLLDACAEGHCRIAGQLAPVNRCRFLAERIGDAVARVFLTAPLAWPPVASRYEVRHRAQRRSGEGGVQSRANERINDRLRSWPVERRVDEHVTAGPFLTQAFASRR